MHVPTEITAIAAGVSGALWICALWFAAPIFGRSTASIPGRLAGTIALGVALPGVLGMLGILFDWSLWLGLVALVTIRIKMRGVHGDVSPGASGVPWDVIFASGTLVALAWPPAVRPLMDGDSLIYHLPNAAAWALHHSVWTTGTRYWWYPPASELFSSALLAVGGTPVLGIAGVLPAILLVARFRCIAASNGHPPLLGTSIACAFLATPIASAQIVSLQNDLWLAALFIEALASRAPLNFAVLVLIKPQGWFFAFTALFCAGLRSSRKMLWPTLLAGVAALAWLTRDLVLWKNAVIPPASTWYPGTLKTSVAEHFPSSVGVLFEALMHSGVPWTLFFLLGILSIVYVQNKRMRAAAVAVNLFFLFVPFGFDNGTAQLATGQSLRFALPLAALGALLLCEIPARFTVAAISGAILSTLFGVIQVWRSYANDATTHDTILIVVIYTVLFLLVGLSKNPARWVNAYSALAFICLVGWASGLAGAHPALYLDDRYGIAGHPTGAFLFLKTLPPQRLITRGFPAGSAIMVGSRFDVYDALPDTCREGREITAMIVANLASLGEADKMAIAACGKTVYRDTAGLIVVPAP